jgi:LmbE family N-acetylglucosaminyl deacetylase
MQKLNHTPLLFCLKRLGLSKTVLHAGAHPDDEEIGLISYISYRHCGRAVYWSATRGESGQNIVNSYRGDALGVYRTWESLLVREWDGGECLFGPFIDFGFSKTPEEAFIKWGRENLVRELVRAIRLVQPQVIISRWAGTKDDGHGHHQAVAQALAEAFLTAGSPDRYPEQVSTGLPPWNASKFYRSTNKTIYPSGELKNEMEGEGFLKVNTGGFSPLLGCTYQEQAWMAYGRHQTQGMEVLPAPGDFFYYLKLISSDPEVKGLETDPFHGIETGLAGIFSGTGPISEDALIILKEVEGLVGESIDRYSPENPSLSAQPLLEGLTLMKGLKGLIPGWRIPEPTRLAMAYGLDNKIREFEEVAAICLGLRLESRCSRARVTPGESVWVNTRLWNFSDTPVGNVALNIRTPSGWKTEQTYAPAAGDASSGSMSICEAFIGDDAELSCPYWLRHPGKAFMHDFHEENSGRDPMSTAALSAECSVTIGPNEIRLSCPTVHKKAFPGGCRELPLFVVPPISLHPESDKRIFLVSSSEIQFSFQVTARCNDEERPAEGRLELMGPQGWRICPPFIDVTLAPVSGAATRSFEIAIPPGTPEGRYLISFSIRCRERDYGVVLTPVRMGAPGLPNPDDPSTCAREELLLTPARAEIFIIDARLRQGQRYGYIEGASEETLPVLESLGMNVSRVQDAEIAHGDLSVYDAIIAGPNAYLLRSQLAENAHRLLEYVEMGGTLIVQYHTFGYQGRGFAPYPFTYSRPHDRVTDESAPVTILAPENQLFHYPNEITGSDFDNWVHDRGLYFFGGWDEFYEPLLSCADRGEEQKKGGLMHCEYGKGRYIYTGYSLFRQLPAGVSGAFRLFFNMLSMKPSSGR